MLRYPFLSSKVSKRKLAIGPAAIAPVMVLLLWSMGTRGISPLTIVSASPGAPRIYTTKFPLTENPISEGGTWICGQTVGLDSWQRTGIGFA